MNAVNIEKGKFYLNRSGGIVGPISETGDSVLPWFGILCGAVRLYRQDGTAAYGPALDLVSEYPVKTGNEPNHQPAAVDPRQCSALSDVLTEAYEDAANGKGHHRHGDATTPFLDQPSMQIGRMVGVGYPIGQAMKKAHEASTRTDRGDYSGAVHELLGVINYAALAILLIREK